MALLSLNIITDYTTHYSIETPRVPGVILGYHYQADETGTFKNIHQVLVEEISNYLKPDCPPVVLCHLVKMMQSEDQK